MANWKKMAEEFGRALAHSKGAIKDNPSGTERSVLEVFDKHKDDDVGDAFSTGYRTGTQERIGAESHAETAQAEGVRGSLQRLTDEQLDHINDTRTDVTLDDDFDKEFKAAIERRKQGVKDRFGKDYPQDMAQEGADTFEEDLWNVIDELRAKGMSGNDILNILKGK